MVRALRWLTSQPKSLEAVASMLGTRPHGGLVGDLVAEEPADFELDLGLGEGVTDAGVVNEAATVELRLLDECEELQPEGVPLGDALNAGPFEVQVGCDDVPAAVLLTDEGGLRDADVLKGDEAEAGIVGHVQDGADGDAGTVEIDHEDADAAMLGGVGVGPGGEPDVVEPVGAIPDLCAVHDVVVAVLDCAGREAGEVGAGVWLAVADGDAELAAGDGREELLLLLFGADHDDGGTHLALGDEVVGDGCAAEEHLFAVDEALPCGRSRGLRTRLARGGR